MTGELCRLLEDSGALSDRCLIYIEQDRSRAEATLPKAWQIVKNKTAGNVRYMLAQRENRQGK
jgi:16S rRNA (guanine966-N2)-methyltransferase